jgi:DNA-binding transcriptional LysR family regulator
MLTIAEGPLLAVFAAVVRRGSFSGAATELKLSKSVVSERLQRLEALCGARLLERTTRRMRLTEAGAAVLEAATRAEALLQQTEQVLDERQQEPTGTLRVATTHDLGSLLVAPAVARVVSAWPRLRVEVLVDDAARDVLEARVDVAIRLGAPKDSSFIVRKLATVEEPIVGAPAVVEALGRVTRPRELSRAPWVRHTLLPGPALRFTGPGGAVDELVPTVRVEANSGATLVSLLLHGAGLGVMPEHALREHLASGRLVRVCPGWSWKRVSVYALTPSKASGGAALKVFLAEVKAQLARDRLRWAEV